MPDRSMASSVEPVGIGERLRNAREARGWSLADVSERTRIRAVYLQALEEEQFDRLPGKIYLRGFLRTYAVTLGLNPDELFDDYRLEFDAPAQPIVGAHPVEVPIRPAARPSPIRRILTSAGVVVFFVVFFLGYIGYQQIRRFAAPVTPPGTSSQPVPPARPRTAPTPAPAPAPKPAPPAPATPSTPQDARADAAYSTPAETYPRVTPAERLTVILRATEDSWIRISADGRRAFQGFIKAGEVQTWTARSQLTVRIGNAPGVSVEVNGQPFQPPPRRRVWEQTFRAP